MFFVSPSSFVINVEPAEPVVLLSARLAMHNSGAQDAGTGLPLQLGLRQLGGHGVDCFPLFCEPKNAFPRACLALLLPRDLLDQKDSIEGVFIYSIFVYLTAFMKDLLFYH